MNNPVLCLGPKLGNGILGTGFSPAVPRQVLLLLIKLLDMEWWKVLGVGEE